MRKSAALLPALRLFFAIDLSKVERFRARIRKKLTIIRQQMLIVFSPQFLRIIR
jgi:hypothetical protein